MTLTYIYTPFCHVWVTSTMFWGQSMFPFKFRHLHLNKKKKKKRKNDPCASVFVIINNCLYLAYNYLNYRFQPQL